MAAAMFHHNLWVQRAWRIPDMAIGGVEGTHQMELTNEHLLLGKCTHSVTRALPWSGDRRGILPGPCTFLFCLISHRLVGPFVIVASKCCSTAAPQTLPANCDPTVFCL